MAEDSPSDTMEPHDVYFSVYALEGCPYSQKALALLENSQMKYASRIVKQEEKAHFKEFNQMKTFPQIFVQMVWITGEGRKVTRRKKLGGFTELSQALT